MEFEDEKSVNNLLSASSHLENVQVVPVNSQFLWFRAANKRTLKSNHNKVNISLLVENGTKEYRDEEIREQLRKCNSVTKIFLYTLIFDSNNRLLLTTGIGPNILFIPKNKTK